MPGLPLSTVARRRLDRLRWGGLAAGRPPKNARELIKGPIALERLDQVRAEIARVAVAPTVERLSLDGLTQG